jgi:GAF domain-containing protein
MDAMRAVELLGGLLVVAGAGFLVASIAAGRRTAPDIPQDLSRRWRWIAGMMAFFLIGYLVFAAVILLSIPVPETLVAGAVFFGGAVFVYLVIDLTRRTVQRVKTVELSFRELNQTLEQQVADRARAAERRSLQLQTTAEIARLAVETADPGPLMVQATDLIRDRFGFYHASVFTLDENGAWAVLRASTGEAGRALLTRSHRLAVGSPSMVGWVTENRLPRISNDVAQDPFHYKNPLLPETRSELTLPMVVAGRLIGVLDVQSSESNAFQEEDVRTLEAITSELAIAIDNARLVRETQDELARTEGVVSGRASESWARFARAGIPTMLRVGASEDGLRETSLSLAAHARQTAETARSEDGAEVAVPILVRGEAVATITARRPAEGETWSDDDIGVIEAAASQVGLALESARQYAEEQRRVSELEVVNRVAQAVSQLLRLDSLYRVVYAQLVQVVPATEVAIGLYDPATDQLQYPFWSEDGEPSSKPLEPVGNDLAAYVLRTRQPLTLIDDVAGQAAILGLDLPANAPLSWMGAPLLAGESLLGVILVSDRRQEGRFSEDDSALLATIASQVATAIQNSHLIEETQRTARRERLIHEITSKMRRAPDIRSILDTTAREVGRALNASRASVHLGETTLPEEPQLGAAVEAPPPGEESGE